jgi:hypothetical protein
VNGINSMTGLEVRIDPDTGRRQLRDTRHQTPVVVGSRGRRRMSPHCAFGELDHQPCAMAGCGCACHSLLAAARP